MRIIQMVTSLTYGDAVGSHVLAIDTMLREMSIQTSIYAEHIGNRINKEIAFRVSEMPKLNKEDIIIYHAAIATDLNYLLPKLPGRKIFIYHNITPPDFFKEYSSDAERACREGLEQMQYLADKVDYCITVSEFNKNDLIKMGFKCPIDVCPILIRFSDYETKPQQRIIQKYSGDKMTNLLFLGRIAPNKKQENVIRAFYFYQKYFNPKSRLFLVGSGDGPYLNRLIDYADVLGVLDRVIFTGHTPFDEILAYYCVADAFVCMSEHEGFCVPLVEAMYFDTPIIAYDTTAIPYTLGGSGVLLASNDPIEAAEAIDKVIRDAEYREQIKENQRKRLRDFDQMMITNKMRELINAFIQQKSDMQE